MPRLASNLENLIFRGASPTPSYEGLPGAPGGSLPRAQNKMTNIPSISLSTKFPQDTAEHQVLSLLPFPCPGPLPRLDPTEDNEIQTMDILNPFFSSPT